MARTLFSSRGFVGGLAIGLSVGLLVLIGTLLPRPQSASPSSGVPSELTEKLLHASATDSGETLALATGAIDEQVEGLFVLDYLTGELNCFVLNNRTTKFAARYSTNVIATLGIQQDKKPDFVMVTGLMNFLRGPGVARPGNCVVYVADANTGRFAAFGVPWVRNAAGTANPITQVGSLVLLDIGQARTVAIE